MPRADVLVSYLVLLLSTGARAALNVTYDPSSPRVFVDDQLDVTVTFSGSPEDILQVRNSNWTVTYHPARNLGATFDQGSIFCYDDFLCNATVSLQGRFLGFGTVELWRKDKIKDIPVKIKEGPTLKVTVLRLDKVINKVFTAFVATVVTINYINMGCALDIGVVKKVLRRPVGPAVGAFCQFVVMPLVSYGVGLLVFDDPVLRLGLFTFGSSPGGGASNMWTVLLGGNLNLSITMTFVSTIAALGTIPFWLFTLGRTIVQGTNIVIPFQNILISLVSLTVPIAIGIFIQRRFPHAAARSKCVLAPVCIALLVAIIVLASIANSYIFFMLTWSMVAAASLSVWTGFAAGVAASLVARFDRADAVAVAVETGIQNSGIAFLLLSYSLEAPVSDMASVVPVAASIITPVPLFAIYCYQKMKNCCCRKDGLETTPIAARENERGGEVNVAMKHVDD